MFYIRRPVLSRSRTAISIALFTSFLFVASAEQAAAELTELVSIATNGQQGNDISGRFSGPAISEDAQIIAFDSQATTLVPGDTNLRVDVFVHDRTSGITERVSVDNDGVQGNGTSTRPVVDALGRRRLRPRPRGGHHRTRQRQ